MDFFKYMLVLLVFKSANSYLRFEADKGEVLVARGGDVTINFKFFTDEGTITFTYLNKTEQFQLGDITSVTINNIEAATTYNFQAKTSNQTASQSIFVDVHSPPKIISSTPEQLILGEKGTSLNCRAEGTPLPSIRWYKNPNTGNTLSQSHALFLKNDTTSVGEYVCVAQNELNGVSYKDTKTTFVADNPGPPKILETQTNKCWNGINITWIPDAKSYKLQHRIEIFNLAEAKEAWKDLQPTGNHSQTAIIENLPQMQRFNAKIQVCLLRGSCVVGTETYFNTSKVGISRPMIMRAETNLRENVCSVKWIPSPDLHSNITNYTVTVKKQYAQEVQAPREIDDKKILDKGTQTYSFTMNPNRKYTIVVQAANCAGVGGTHAAGSCITKLAAPDEVKPISARRNIINGTAAVEFLPANQSNGAISCYFIMGKIISDDEDAFEDRGFTLQRLNRAQKATNNESVILQHREYIAYALPSSRGIISNITLGSNVTTKCDISKVLPTPLRARRRVNVTTTNTSETTAPGTEMPTSPTEYTARNYILDEQLTYKFTVVTVTPASNTYLFQTSFPLLLGKNSEPGNVNGKLVIVIVIPVVAVLLLIFVAVMLYKRRQRKKRQNNENEDATPTFEEDASPPITSHETGESAYVNLSANETDPQQQNDEQVKYVNLQVNEIANILNENQPGCHGSFYEAVDSVDINLADVQDEGLYMAPMRNSTSTIPDGNNIYANLQSTSQEPPQSSPSTDEPTYINM